MKLRNTVKKIAALTTGTAMIGATMMGAMAAVDLQQYPAPFVSNGTFQGYFVVGETAQPADVISMTDIGMSLQAAAVVETVVPLPGEYAQTVVAGGAKFASGTQDLYYGVQLNDSKSVFTDSDLQVLRRTQVTTRTGVNYDVDFRVTSPGAVVEYGTDVNDLRDPTLYVNLKNTDLVMQVIFPRALNINDTRGESMTLFGKEYVVAESAAETNQAEKVLTLYMAALDKTFEAGTTETVDVGGKDYRVTVVGVNTGSDTPSATVTINGETRQVLQGQPYTFAGERFYIKDVMGYTVPVGGGAVRLFIGSDKLVLKDGDLVTTGESDEVIDGTLVSFTGTDTTSRIEITVEPERALDRVEGLEFGDDYVDPVFGALKMSFADAVPGLDSETRDHVRLFPSANDRLSLRFTNFNGQEYSIELLRGQNTTLSTYQYGSGADQRYVLHGTTGSATTLGRNNRFILTNDETSRVLEVVQVRNTSGSEQVRFRDVGTGGTTYEGSGASGVVDIGGQPIEFNIVSGTETVNISQAVGRTIYTRDGARLELPVPQLNLSNGVHALNTSANFVFTEETSYNDGVPTMHGYFNLPVTYDHSETSGRKIRVSAPTWTEVSSTSVAWSNMISSDTNTDRQSGVTPYGTYVLYDDSTSGKSVDLYYPKGQMYFNVFLAPAGATTVTGGGEGEITSQQVNRINVGSVIFDTQAVNLIGQENMIVVGGPCVNTVAMRLMGTPEVCTEGFEVGKAWVKYFEHQDGKVSLMVAGYSARDTTLAGQVLANYDRYQAQLQGKEVVVSGGSLSQVQIETPAMSASEQMAADLDEI